MTGGYSGHGVSTGPNNRARALALSTALAAVAAVTMATGGAGAAQQGTAPELGRTVNIALVEGTVLVRPKGEKQFHRLTVSELVPIGSTIDTRNGRVGLTSAVDTYGAVRTGEFWAGLFVVTQRRRTNAVTELLLRGRLANCPAKGTRSSAAAAKRKKGRRLWGNGKGKFRTKGRRSSALVRGTVWLVYDQCDASTYNAVRTGKVDVRDFRLKKTIRLTAGRKYIAR